MKVDIRVIFIEKIREVWIKLKLSQILAKVCHDLIQFMMTVVRHRVEGLLKGLNNLFATWFDSQLKVSINDSFSKSLENQFVKQN